MSGISGPSIINSGLVLALDAANKNSYPGTGTSWLDLSGNNNGTLTNGPTFSSANGGSIVFDGTNDYVDCGAANYCNVINITVGVWVKISSSSSGDQFFLERYISGLNGFYFIYGGTSSKFSVQGRESNAAYLVCDSVKTYAKGNWYHFFWTKSASTWSLYVNGVLDVSTSLGNGTTAFITGGDLTIGAYRDNVEFYYLNGNIATTQIYNRALSANEVLQNYNATKARFGL